MRAPRSLPAALTALVGVVATAAVTVTVLAPPAAAEDVYLRPASGSWTVDGHGWGHGHGLSQYGAQGGASIGKTADQITAFYYPNTTKAVIANTAMRVLLSSDSDSTTEVYPAAGLVATDLATGATATLPGGYNRWRAVVDSAGLHLQSASDSTTGWTTHPMNGSASFAGPLRFSGPTFVRLALAGGTSRDYRGGLQAVKTSPTTLSTVDVLSMEDYLLGVVPRESLSSWQPAALQAQAIAARSYSDYKRDHVAASAQSDICDTTTCQVFGGSAVYAADGSATPLEPQTTSDAIRATAGVVRVDAAGASIFAEFNSSSGGWTADGAKPYLIAQRDDWDGLVPSTVHSWSTTLPVSALERAFPAVGTLQRLRITGRDGNGDWGGRITTAVLEGTDSQGASTSVTTTGTALKKAFPWPGGQAEGLRSIWWQVRPAYDSKLVSRTSDVTLVKAPGTSGATLAALVENTGTTAWPVNGLHLAVATPAGAADPLVGGSTSPGRFIRNRTNPGATSVLPGDQVDFAVGVNAAGVSTGVRTASYRVQLGVGNLLGDAVSWTVTVQPPTFTGRSVASPVVVSSTLPADGPAALLADGRTVVVPVNGSTVLRLAVSPAGNLTWPVGGASPLRLGTSAPRDRNSTFAGAGWLSSGRPAALAAAGPVAPGATGTFDLRLNGNNAPVGVFRESFEPVWEGQSWIAGAASALTVVRVDTSVSRAAVTDTAPMASVALSNAPTGTGTIVVRLRNVGGEVWTVGQESLQTSAPATMATAAWRSSTRPPPLTGNASRPGQQSVAPGEVGEWRIPLTGAGKPVGTTSMVLRAVGPTGGYGPSFTLSTKVFAASVAGQLVAKSASVRVPSGGTAVTWFDVRNVGNSAWPVGGALHSLVPAGSSPSRAGSWLSASRPASLSSNVSAPGSSLVQPGQTARFRIVLAGNGRSPRQTSETFGIIWDGFRRISLSVVLAYAVG